MERINEILARKAEIKNRFAAIAKEVDMEGADIQALNKESDDLAKERAALDKEEVKLRAQFQSQVEDTHFEGVVKQPAQRSAKEDESLQYRKSFMKFCQTGVIDDVLKRSQTNTLVADTVVVPVEITNKIYEKLAAYGEVFGRVTKTNFPTGINVPVSSVKVAATWVGEGTTAEGKKKTVTNLNFSIHKVQVKVPVSLEAATMSLEVFERTIVENNYEAILVAVETAIISGAGTNDPKGIISETVVSGQTEAVTAANLAKYKTYVDALAKVPLAYQGKVAWCFNNTDWLSNIIGMVDTQGNPVARVNYGINGMPERTFLGRPVVLVEDNGMKTFAAASATNVFAFLFDFADYILNSNMQITYKKYFDEDTDLYYHKSTMLCDGKVADKNSLVTLTKSA